MSGAEPLICQIIVVTLPNKWLLTDLSMNPSYTYKAGWWWTLFVMNSSIHKIYGFWNLAFCSNSGAEMLGCPEPKVLVYSKGYAHRLCNQTALLRCHLSAVCHELVIWQHRVFFLLWKIRIRKIHLWGYGKCFGTIWKVLLHYWHIVKIQRVAFRIVIIHAF